MNTLTGYLHHLLFRTLYLNGLRKHTAWDAYYRIVSWAKYRVTGRIACLFRGHIQSVVFTLSGHAPVKYCDRCGRNLSRKGRFRYLSVA